MINLNLNFIVTQKQKFIILGLQKAGTTSFQEYFTKIGLKSAHYIANNEPVAYSIYKAKKEKKPIFHYLQDFDALTEMNYDANYRNLFTCYYPQIDDFNQILAENPEAVYILNSRDIEKQVKSMIKSGSGTGYNILTNCKNKYLLKSVPLANRKYHTNPSILLYNWIYEHNKFLRSFFSQNPQYNFVDFSIEAGDLGLLKPFLNLTTEFQNVTFPHANINPNNV